MPPRKRPTSSGRGRASDKTDRPPDSAGRGGGGGRGRRTPRLARNPDADPVRIHRQYVQERIGGGELPTPEAYERAVDEWHRLPGAVRAPASEVHPLAEQVAGALEQVAEELIETGAAGPAARYEGMLPATDPGDNSPYEERWR
jgi:hypothetical protein